MIAPCDMTAIGDRPEPPPGLALSGPPFSDGDIGGALDDPYDYVANRHNGGRNIVFCDAHMEFGKQTNWMKAVTGVRKRWNRDNQPYPETWH